MNPIKLVTRPIRNLTEAIVMPLRALFVVGLCALINWATSPGQWWVQWVALGMGIAVLVAWARAARTLVVLGIVAWVGWKIYQRYGATARTRFEVVDDIHRRGTTVLLVEQNASRALGLADRGYVMDSGEVTMDGAARELLADPRVRAAYLGE